MDVHPTSFQLRIAPSVLLSTTYSDTPNHTTILTLTGTRTTTPPTSDPHHTPFFPTGSCHAYATHGLCPLNLTYQAGILACSSHTGGRVDPNPFDQTAPYRAECFGVGTKPRPGGFREGIDRGEWMGT